MTLTVLGEAKTDEATDGRFFDASEQWAQAAKEAFVFSESFYSEHERLFRKLGSRMLLRATLLPGGELAPWHDYPDQLPSLNLVLDARKRRAQKYTWEINRFDQGIGSHIRQLVVTPLHIEAQQFDLDTRGNLKRHRAFQSSIAVIAMNEVRATALEPITQDYMARTALRIRNPLPTGDHTDVFPHSSR